MFAKSNLFQSSPDISNQNTPSPYQNLEKACKLYYEFVNEMTQKILAKTMSLELLITQRFVDQPNQNIILMRKFILKKIYSKIDANNLDQKIDAPLFLTFANIKHTIENAPQPTSLDEFKKCLQALGLTAEETAYALKIKKYMDQCTEKEISFLKTIYLLAKQANVSDVILQAISIRYRTEVGVISAQALKNDPDASRRLVMASLLPDSDSDKDEEKNDVLPAEESGKSDLVNDDIKRFEMK